MKIRFLFVIIVSVLILISCGGDSNCVDLNWEGTWMSEKNYDQRGTFTFDLRVEYEELSGTITISGMGIEDLEVVGEASKDYSSSGVGGTGTVVLTHIDFSDLEDEITFGATVYTHDIDSETEIKGIYSNAATGDSGRWYCRYTDRIDFSSISSVPLDSSIGSVRDMCFDGENLWVLEVDTEFAAIYKVDEGNGNVIESFDIHGIFLCPFGLTWDGSYLWCGYDDSLYQLNTLCAVISSVPYDEHESYLTYASGYIWSIIRSYMLFDSKLCRIDPSNGNVEEVHDLNSRDLGGLAYAGTNLWASFSYDQYDWTVIYKIDMSGNFIETYNSPCYRPGVLAGSGSFLYCIDAWNRRIFKLGI